MSILQKKTDRDSQILKEWKFENNLENTLDVEVREIVEKTKDQETYHKIEKDIMLIGELVPNIPKKIVGSRHVFLNTHQNTPETFTKRVHAAAKDLIILKKVYGAFIEGDVGFVNFHYLTETEKENEYELASIFQELKNTLSIDTVFYRIEKGKRSLEINYQFLPKNLIILYGDFMTKGLFLEIQKVLENVGKNILCFYKTIQT